MTLLHYRFKIKIIDYTWPNVFQEFNVFFCVPILFSLLFYRSVGHLIHRAYFLQVHYLFLTLSVFRTTHVVSLFTKFFFLYQIRRDFQLVPCWLEDSIFEALRTISLPQHCFFTLLAHDLHLSSLKSIFQSNFL